MTEEMNLDEQETTIDPDAPYGRKQNGTPYLHPNEHSSPRALRSLQRERRGYIAEYYRAGICSTEALRIKLEQDHDIRVPASTVTKDINSYLRRCLDEQAIGRDQWRARLVERLMMGAQAITNRIQHGDYRAIQCEIAIQKRISEMLGLDATLLDRVEDYGAQLAELIAAQDKVIAGIVPPPPAYSDAENIE